MGSGDLTVLGVSYHQVSLANKQKELLLQVFYFKCKCHWEQSLTKLVSVIIYPTAFLETTKIRADGEEIWISS